MESVWREHPALRRRSIASEKDLRKTLSAIATRSESWRPHGEWNVLELVTHGNDVKQYVNGKLANEATDPFPAEGKILFQSEGSEVFFRNITLYPLK